MSVWGIVPAGGSGLRFGARKQYLTLGGVTLLERAIAALQPLCDGVVVALPEGDSVELPSGVAVVTGGATRLSSVRAALAVVPADAEIVVIHGAVHPLASQELTAAVIAAVRAGADASFPFVPVLDALKQLDAEFCVVATVPKTGVVSAQTPQAFRASMLRAVHAEAPEAAEDTELIDRAGGRVVGVPGDPANIHIATPADLHLAAALVTGVT